MRFNRVVSTLKLSYRRKFPDYYRRAHEAGDMTLIAPLLRLVASPELTGNKDYESLTEVFGPLWLIPLDPRTVYTSMWKKPCAVS
jgi:hypothetical protein